MNNSNMVLKFSEMQEWLDACAFFAKKGMGFEADYNNHTLMYEIKLDGSF
jgi:hypothetical protein